MNQGLNIAISSGKGGTGKTFISTNITYVLNKMHENVKYFDCDVEEPNGHLFLKPEIIKSQDITVLSPSEINTDKCTGCGKCVEACSYNACAKIKKSILFFRNLCHICGACTLACPHDAIILKERKIGELKYGKSDDIECYYALLETGEGGMSPRLIRKVKENIDSGINIIDSAPGTACPVVETIKNTDACVLVTDPTPFGLHDLILAVNMCRKLGIEPVVVINRGTYHSNDLKDYCSREELFVIGEIPDDLNIARAYSNGEIAAETVPGYDKIFSEIASRIVDYAKNNTGKKIVRAITEKKTQDALEIKCDVYRETGNRENIKEIVVISGKGGTGKTSITAGFASIEKNIAIADCDVDAPDLHLILEPVVQQKGYFSGGKIAEIIKDKCISCGDCYNACRFDAVIKQESGNNDNYLIDPVSCEGCNACFVACRHKAIKQVAEINGEWYKSSARFGPVSHAVLGVAQENSGKLVSLVRKNMIELAAKSNHKIALIDGSPGTGCPVISSIAGAYYTVVVTEPTISGVHDLKRILDVIKYFNIRSGIVINKHDLNPEKSKEIEIIAEENDSEVLGKIPYDNSFVKAQFKKQSIIEYKNSPACNSIEKIWALIKKRIN